jgi:hypothetical protein
MLTQKWQTRVSVHQWSVLRDPKNFVDPSAFIPERWIKRELAGQRGDHLETSLPFSYGPRGLSWSKVSRKYSHRFPRKSLDTNI